MKKIKSIISFVLAFCLIIPTMFLLTACGSKLSNDSGFKLDGGGFEKGSVLNTSKLENTSEDASEVYDKLKGFGVGVSDKSKAFIYDIYVSKDDKKVQPNGKVKITAKVEENDKGYKVYHIKDDDTVEELEATYKKGTLTFETSSFSYYVFVATDAVDINPIATAGSEAEWNKAINFWQAQNNVKVVEKIVSPHSYDEAHGNEGANFRVYQLENNAYSEDGYVENVEATKGLKLSYFVKESEDKYSYIYWGTLDVECWVKNPEISKEEFEGCIKNIYECGSYGMKSSDFTYGKFTYDAINKNYKYNDDNITVKLEFNGSNVDKIIITYNRDSDNTIFERTITFGNAEVNVPEDARVS